MMSDKNGRARGQADFDYEKFAEAFGIDDHTWDNADIGVAADIIAAALLAVAAAIHAARDSRDD